MHIIVHRMCTCETKSLVRNLFRAGCAKNEHYFSCQSFQKFESSISAKSFIASHNLFLPSIMSSHYLFVMIYLYNICSYYSSHCQVILDVPPIYSSYALQNVFHDNVETVSRTQHYNFKDAAIRVNIESIKVHLTLSHG